MKEKPRNLYDVAREVCHNQGFNWTDPRTLKTYKPGEQPVRLRVKAKLVKLSVCPCGFTLLDDSVLMGTEYEVDPNDMDVLHLTCGNCGKKIPLKSIYTYARGESRGGYLPEQIFEIQSTNQEKDKTYGHRN